MKEYRVEFSSVSPFGRMTPRTAAEAAQLQTPEQLRARIFAAAADNALVRQCIEYGRSENMNALDLMTTIAFNALCQREIMYEEHLRLVASVPLPRFYVR